MLMNEIWRNRNDSLFNNGGWEPSVIIERTRMLMEEMQSPLMKSDPNPQLKAKTTGAKWEKPRQGFLKINTDAAVDINSGCGIGVVVRNEVGEVQFMAAKKVQDSTEVELVEAEAMLWATQLSVREELTHVIFESDSQSLILKLQKNEKIKGAIGTMLEEIRLLSRKMVACEWRYCRRSANKTADFLVHIKPTSIYFSCFNNVTDSALVSCLAEDLV